jgi:hypothetical protein
MLCYTITMEVIKSSSNQYFVPEPIKKSFIGVGIILGLGAALLFAVGGLGMHHITIFPHLDPIDSLAVGGAASLLALSTLTFAVHKRKANFEKAVKNLSTITHRSPPDLSYLSDDPKKRAIIEYYVCGVNKIINKTQDKVTQFRLAISLINILKTANRDPEFSNELSQVLDEDKPTIAEFAATLEEQLVALPYIEL